MTIGIFLVRKLLVIFLMKQFLHINGKIFTEHLLNWLGPVIDLMSMVNLGEIPSNKVEWWNILNLNIEPDNDQWDENIIIISHSDYSPKFYSVGELIGEALFSWRNARILADATINKGGEEPYANLSAYNKAWPGTRGVLMSENLQASNTANYGIDNIRSNGTTQKAQWVNNERGYLCFTKKDKFVITFEDIGETITINADKAHFMSERTRVTRQCLRSEHLANKTGKALYVWGCLDYLQELPWSSPGASTWYV